MIRPHKNVISYHLRQFLNRVTCEEFSHYIYISEVISIHQRTMEPHTKNQLFQVVCTKQVNFRKKNSYSNFIEFVPI